MLVVGTKPEHFNAVWVKNEWSRFLKLLKQDRSKLLIPCYKDMDAYDLPDEFAHLQSQDMSKIGFITDVVRGVKKIVATSLQHNEEKGYQKQEFIVNKERNMPQQPQKFNAKTKFFLILSSLSFIIAEVIVLLDITVGL